MEESPNGSNNDMPTEYLNLAQEIFEKLNKFVKERLPGNQTDSRVQFVSVEATTVQATKQSEGKTDAGSHDVCQDGESVLLHFISTVVFRCMRQANGDDWELESFSDYVDIRMLDEIGSESDVKIAMARNPDIVLLRNIKDWSRPDGNVWSLQIVWSGSFLDSRRMLLLMEMDSPSIHVRVEGIELHRSFKHQYIALHETFPLAAAISAVDSSRFVVISEELVGEVHSEGEGEGFLCAICHDMIYLGEPAKQLRCSHIFHEHCIVEWFYTRLQCPLCRNEIQL